MRCWPSKACINAELLVLHALVSKTFMWPWEKSTYLRVSAPAEVRRQIGGSNVGIGGIPLAKGLQLWIVAGWAIDMSSETVSIT